MTELRDVLLLAHRLLDQAGADHALIGAMALGFLGVYRATMDVDLLVEGRRVAEVKAELQNGGFQLLDEGPESLQFGGIGALDVLLAKREASLEMLSRAQSMPRIGMKCVTAEDMIGLKIQAYVNDPRRRLQDQADIVALIRTQANLDWDRIRRYAELFDEWNAVLALKNESEL
ncbi:MAG: nucleotidyl transferase AbiEii/AbiGii toxin family protein [Gammaproteobacteria bacterium]|nr:nucleotidyl transferase AbiEii/AbiGii toxin family protein [Gammaproteobacteria bacterium]